MNAIKVEVIDIRKRHLPGKDRVDTFAQVRFDSGAHREINVRNLYDFWDSYMDEKEHKLEERRRKDEENARAQREYHERVKAEKLRKRRIADNLAIRLGLDVAAVETAHNGVVIGYNHLKFLEG
jgi:hypothetical protein